MNSLLFLIALRSSAMSLALAGQQSLANTLYLLADSIAAGRASDAHMAEIAAKLSTRHSNKEDWSDVIQRIEADSTRLQSHQP